MQACRGGGYYESNLDPSKLNLYYGVQYEILNPTSMSLYNLNIEDGLLKVIALNKIRYLYQKYLILNMEVKLFSLQRMMKQ